jgi:nitrogen regulatory protein PII
MTLTTHPKKQLTVVAEAVLEKPLIAFARASGVQSYTVADVRGGGEYGDKEAAWDIDRMIELKLVASDAVVELIVNHIMERYAAHYAVSMFLSDVQVLRPGRY